MRFLRMPADAIGLIHRRSGLRPHRSFRTRNLESSTRLAHSEGRGGWLDLAPQLSAMGRGWAGLALRASMVGLWRPQTAGLGYGDGRERLEPLSLDNVTARRAREKWL